MEEEETLSNPFYEASITLIPKLNKYKKILKLQTNFPHEYRCQNPKQNMRKYNLAVCKKNYTP